MRQSRIADNTNQIDGNRFLGESPSNSMLKAQFIEQESIILFNNLINITSHIINSAQRIKFNTTLQSGTNIIRGSQLGGNYWAGFSDNQTLCNPDGNNICQNIYNLTDIIDYFPLAIPKITLLSVIISSPANQTYNTTNLTIVANTDVESSCEYSLDNVVYYLIDTSDNLTHSSNVTLLGGNYQINISCSNDYSQLSNYTSFNVIIDLEITNISNCTNISNPGNYQLTQSIINSDAGTCINITTSDVWFNGNGFTIDGIDVTGSYGIFVGNSTATLNNVRFNSLTLNDWTNGAYVQRASNATVFNTTYTSNTNGLIISLAKNYTIYNNSFIDEIYGLYIHWSLNNTINNNYITNNIYPILLYQGSKFNTVVNNIAISNNVGIIASWANTDNLVINNTFNSNTYGIYLMIGSNYNTFVNNSLTGNVYSIYVDTSDNNTFTDNSVINSGIIDYWSISSIDNTVIRMDLGPTILSFKGYDFYIKNASLPAQMTNNLNNINKFINISNSTGAGKSWIFLNVSYKDSELGNAQENTLRMSRYNGSWYTNPSTFASTFGVDTINNYVYANITAPLDFVTFATLGLNTQINSCTNITEPGFYNLTQSITNSDAGACINITTSGVVLNGDGFTIDGMDNNPSSGISAFNVSNISIIDLNVADWFYGILFLNISEFSINNISGNSNRALLEILDSTNGIITNTHY